MSNVIKPVSVYAKVAGQPDDCICSWAIPYSSILCMNNNGASVYITLVNGVVLDCDICGAPEFPADEAQHNRDAWDAYEAGASVGNGGTND